MSPEEPKQEETKQYDLKGDRFHEYAQAIADGECGNFVYCFEGIIKFYEYKDNYWQGLSGEEEFLSIIQDKLIRDKKIKTKDKDGNDTYKVTKGKILTSFIPSRKKQVTEHFKLIKNVKLDHLNKYPFLNFENTMYDPVGLNSFKHGPEYFSTIRVPYKYQLLAECPLWLKTIEEIMESDLNKISSLQEFFGYCLLPETKYKKALLLLGETDTGKSTILNILRKVLGEKNCSSVPLKCFNKDNQIPNMIGKLVNIDADVSKDAAEYEAGFKIITSGDPIHCDPKYVQPFDFVPKCKIVLAANIFPKITDHSSAFYNRLILIPLNRRFTDAEMNRELPILLEKELPGILNWSIKGLQTLTKRGGFNIHSFIKDAVDELESGNNPAYTFFEDHIEIDVSGSVYVEKTELYEKYVAWSKKNGAYVLSNILFSAAVNKKYHKQTPKDSRLTHGGRPRVWRNIRYVEFKSDVVKTEIDFSEPAGSDNTPDVKPVNAVESGTGTDINWGEE